VEASDDSIPMRYELICGFATLQGLDPSRRKDEVLEYVERKACPHCGSVDTRLSHRIRGVLTMLLPVFNLSRYRCRNCKRLFVGRN
jgi:transposase-like protein